jgi:hypothetical protein
MMKNLPKFHLEKMKRKIKLKGNDDKNKKFKKKMII